MTGTRYARGTAFERKVAADLIGDGYFVIRAAGSHGLADLVALKPGQVLLVQVKGGERTLTVAEWNALWSIADKLGATALVASRPKRGVIAYHRIAGVAIPRKPRPAVEWSADEVMAA